MLGIGLGIPFNKGGGAVVAAPSGLVAITISETQINITWVDAPGTDGVKIYLSTDGGANYTYNSTVLYGIGFKEITGLTNATLYTIKIVSYMGATESTGITTTAITFNSAMIDGWNFDPASVDNYFDDVLGDKAYQPLGYAASQYFNGKTYIVYNALSDKPYIITYTHATGAWSNRVIIGGAVLTDDHGQPSILIDSSGYIHCVWDSHNSELKYSKSTNPEDITAWTPMTTPTPGAEVCTYPQLIEFSDGTIYLFYRILGGASCDWGYKTSADGGDNWSAATVVSEDIAYWMFRKGVGDTIHAVGFGNNTQAATRLNVYYIFFNGTNWVNITSDVQPTPIILAGNNCKAYDSGDYYCPFAQINHDSTNKPYIIFPRSTVELDYTSLEQVVLKHNGTAWVMVDLAISGEFNTAIVTAFDVESDVFHLYANNYGIDDPYSVVFEHWISNDLGTTWSKYETIAGGNYYYPHVVKDHVANGKIIITQRQNSDVLYVNKGFLWGESGFVSNTKPLSLPSIKSILRATKNAGLTLTGTKYQFTGSPDTILIYDSDLLSFDDGSPDHPFTITLKINVSGVTAVQRIIAKAKAGTYEYYVSIASSKFAFQMLDADGTKNIVARAPYTEINTEVFWCLTYDGAGVETGLKIFKDLAESQNEQVETGTYIGMTNTTTSCYLGSAYDYNYYLVGYLSEVKFWNKVLSLAEMTKVKNNVAGW
ncbi:MAG TPA: BNR-4 repeat-containing protein [Bacteroidales bacterium]|nr:BNR-4 repeat-containing protein [Bacteroidales bacterium]